MQLIKDSCYYIIYIIHDLKFGKFWSIGFSILIEYKNNFQEYKLIRLIFKIINPSYDMNITQLW